MATIDSNDIILVSCKTYNDYLDMYVNKMDLCYVRSMNICRKMVGLNYRSNNSVYTKEVFEERRAKIFEFLFPRIRSPIIHSAGRVLTDPVLKYIASREKPNLQKMVSTIMFINTRTSSGFDQSSYFDLEHSFRHLDQRWDAIFEKRAKLRPRQSHLSFFDSRSHTIRYNDSDNYLIIHDVEHGLTFMHKGDHKKLYVRSRRPRQPNFSRVTIHSPFFGYVEFYDHTIRKKI